MGQGEGASSTAPKDIALFQLAASQSRNVSFARCPVQLLPEDEGTDGEWSTFVLPGTCVDSIGRIWLESPNGIDIPQWEQAQLCTDRWSLPICTIDTQWAELQKHMPNAITSSPGYVTLPFPCVPFLCLGHNFHKISVRIRGLSEGATVWTHAISVCNEHRKYYIREMLGGCLTFPRVIKKSVKAPAHETHVSFELSDYVTQLWWIVRSPGSIVHNPIKHVTITLESQPIVSKTGDYFHTWVPKLNTLSPLPDGVYVYMFSDPKDSTTKKPMDGASSFKPPGSTLHLELHPHTRDLSVDLYMVKMYINNPGQRQLEDQNNSPRDSCWSRIKKRVLGAANEVKVQLQPLVSAEDTKED